ncbi:hypothetical protein [Cellulomonas sp. URHD0024]|uniref:hypothetical protein n=1 Tax=Cellulomonas sp. URHD0024 TaxID=1302620 RepID=UPI0004176FF5|nr:hypothetical protein [Cellulomonas sp. URHD0024]
MSASRRDGAYGRTHKQHRLAALLARRDRLGTDWAERISHGLPGVGQLLEELMVTEWALTEGWPHLGETWVIQWAQADARKLHNPEVGRRGGCQYCATAWRRASA